MSSDLRDEIVLLTPAIDESDPVVSIVVPALNEELTIGNFILWCKEGLAKISVKGEILIVDSSTDNTAAIAVAAGARVLRVPKRGLGRAYIDAMPYIRGKYVIMGDCDCTYDFRELSPFVDKLDQGYEFVMGTRMRGFIEKGAMPPLHRYFGTPLTTWILNSMYGSHYSDIHCGMRAITLDALRRVGIDSQSWEYASEMVIKAVKYDLKTSEVPIRFFKDHEGRLSHHKRSGWFSPWLAGWINLKAMFMYAPDFFLMKPGLFFFISGSIISLVLMNGPVTLFDHTFSLYWLLIGVTLAVVGYSALQMAVLVRVLYDFIPSNTEKYRKLIQYDRGVILGVLLFFSGICFLVDFLVSYIRSGFILYKVSNPAVFGLFLVILGFQTFVFTLVFGAAAKICRRKSITL